jgi:hypothetical protein
VGEPSWILGGELVIDGRTTFAKKYTVVVESTDLAQYVKEDWTGFRSHPTMDKVFKIVGDYVQDKFKKLAAEHIDETKKEIRETYAKEYRNLSPLAKYEVDEAIEAITDANPTAKSEAINLAVEAIIKLEKTRTGKELLIKLSELGEEDITGLNVLLEKWSIKDALTVLDEIDKRISIIEAIQKLSGDDSVDELHVLHPLVTGARWLFGPEFDSAEYVSNKQLQNAAEKVFKKRIEKTKFINHRKRPDIILLPSSMASITGTESFDGQAQLAVLSRILIIELKKGGSTIGREERDQATGYVEDFIGAVSNAPYVDAFVVGHHISEHVQPVSAVSNKSNVEQGKIRVTTYGQLVDTAQKRLFGLRQKLADRYEEVPGMELFQRQSKLEYNG